MAGDGDKAGEGQGGAQLEEAQDVRSYYEDAKHLEALAAHLRSLPSLTKREVTLLLPRHNSKLAPSFRGFRLIAALMGEGTGAAAGTEWPKKLMRVTNKDDAFWVATQLANQGYIVHCVKDDDKPRTCVAVPTRRFLTKIALKSQKKGKKESGGGKKGGSGKKSGGGGGGGGGGADGQPDDDEEMDAHYAWLYAGSQFWARVMTASIVIVCIVIPLFPLWPYALKVGIWYLCSTLLAVLLGIVFLRLIIFFLCWIVGFDVWLFPQFFYDDVTFFEMFNPVISCEPVGKDQLWYRISAVVLLVALGYYIYTRPTEFDRFVSKQRQFVFDMYTGNMLAAPDNGTGTDNDGNDGSRRPTVEELEREAMEEELAASAAASTDDASPDEMMEELLRQDEMNEELEDKQEIERDLQEQEAAEATASGG